MSCPDRPRKAIREHQVLPYFPVRSTQHGFPLPLGRVKHLMTGAIKSRSAGFAVVLASMALVTGCANDRGPYPTLPPIGARFEFLSKNLCEDGRSPEIRLGGVPAGTAAYRLRITNTSIVAKQRWEGTVKAESPLIPEGAMADFDAPCLEDQQVLTYRLEVMALAGDNRPIGYGWAFANARSLPRQIQQEQSELKRRPSERPDRTTFPAARLPPFFQ